MCNHLPHSRPLIQNTKIFPVKALKLEPLVSDRNHFLVDGFIIFHNCFLPLVSNHFMHGVYLCSLCVLCHLKYTKNFSEDMKNIW